MGCAIDPRLQLYPLIPKTAATEGGDLGPLVGWSHPSLPDKDIHADRFISPDRALVPYGGTV
jgi:hypothetical protein